MSTSLGRIASGTVWMAKLLVEEPDALMHARPDLWEPWVVTPRATRPWVVTERGLRVYLNTSTCIFTLFFTLYFGI